MRKLVSDSTFYKVLDKFRRERGRPPTEIEMEKLTGAAVYSQHLELLSSNEQAIIFDARKQKANPKPVE